jgi:hypothetical protein
MVGALRVAQVPVLLTIAAAVLLLTFRDRTELILHAYVLALAAIVLLHIVRSVRAALPPPGPSAFDAGLRRRQERQERLPELEQFEREVALGLSAAFDLHYRLRPVLRRTASELLAVRRGIDLDRSPGAARRALGDETWELVRPDREPPPERFAPGLELGALRRVVVSLEAL